MAFNLGSLVWAIKGDISDFEKKMSASQKGMAALADRATQTGKSLSLKLTLPLAALGGIAIKTAADLETQRVAFGVLLQDVEKGTKLFEDLKNFSAETPLQLGDITKASQVLLAFGIAADEQIDTLRMLGDVGQGSAEKLGRLTLAYGKIRAKGRASLEELNILTEAGVPIQDALAKRFKVSTAELFKMVTAGKIGFEDVKGALTDLTSEGGQFNGMMEKISQTTAGKFSTALDNLKLAAAEIGAVMLPVINDIIDTVTDWAKSFQNLDQGTKELIVKVGLMVAAIGPVLLIFGKAIKTFHSMQAAAAGLSKNFGKISKVLTGPFGIAALAAIAAIAIYKLVTAHDDLRDVTKDLLILDEERRGIVKKLTTDIGNLSKAEIALLRVQEKSLKLKIEKKLQQIKKSYEDLTAGTNIFGQALRKAESRVDSYTQILEETKRAHSEVTKGQDLSTESIKKQFDAAEATGKSIEEYNIELNKSVGTNLTVKQAAEQLINAQLKLGEIQAELGEGTATVAKAIELGIITDKNKLKVGLELFNLALKELDVKTALEARQNFLNIETKRSTDIIEKNNAELSKSNELLKDYEEGLKDISAREQVLGDEIDTEAEKLKLINDLRIKAIKGGAEYAGALKVLNDEYSKLNLTQDAATGGLSSFKESFEAMNAEMKNLDLSGFDKFKFLMENQIPLILDEATAKFSVAIGLLNGFSGALGQSAEAVHAKAAAEIEAIDLLIEKENESLENTALTEAEKTQLKIDNLSEQLAAAHDKSSEEEILRIQDRLSVLNDQLESQNNIENFENQKLNIETKAAKKAAQLQYKAELADYVAKLIEIPLTTAAASIKAFNSLVGIPFAGPFLGAAAAASTTALGVRQLAIARKNKPKAPQFQQGVFDIPADTSAFVHAGETILTKPITESLKDNDISITGPAAGGSGKMTQVIVKIGDDTLYNKIHKDSQNGKVLIDEQAIVQS